MSTLSNTFSLYSEKNAVLKTVAKKQIGTVASIKIKLRYYAETL